MKELATLLSGLPEGEKNEALKYYEDYFEDAGQGMEDQVMNELGTPQKVAKIIKEGLNDTENVTNERAETRNLNTHRESHFDRTKEGKETQEKHLNDKKESMSGSKIALLIVLILFAIPVGLPLVVGVFGVVIGLLAAVFGVFLSIAVTGIALMVSGIVVFSVGLVKIFTSPPIGILSCGVGLILIAVGILLTLGMVLACIKCVPVCVKGISNLVQSLSRRRRNFV
jgi:uncharacterized membrane protein